MAKIEVTNNLGHKFMVEERCLEKKKKEWETKTIRKAPCYYGLVVSKGTGRDAISLEISGDNSRVVPMNLPELHRTVNTLKDAIAYLEAKND